MTAAGDDLPWAERMAQWGALNAAGSDLGFRTSGVAPRARCDLLATMAAILAEDQSRREATGARLFAALRDAGATWADLLPFAGTPAAAIDIDSVPSILAAIDRTHASPFDLAVIAVVAAKPLHSARDLAGVREVFGRCHHRSHDERRAPLASGDF